MRLYPAWDLPGWAGLGLHFSIKMNLKETALDWVRSVVGRHIASNVRRFNISTYLGIPNTNALGYTAYLGPQEGKVVEVGEQFTLFKLSATKFLAVLNSLLTEAASVGDKVRVEGYQLRRFDGSLADGSEDPVVNGCRTLVLGGASSLFPAKWPGRFLGINEKFADAYKEIINPYLQDMIKQLEELPIDGGRRRVINCLIDAGASAPVFVDPSVDKTGEVAPAIRVTVATRKFAGSVELFYSRADDMYSIRLHSDATGSETVLDDITFEVLGEALQDAIDDGAWQLARVTVVARPKASKAVPVQGA